jgi:DNA-binding beta-propeller fold protein YncE
VRLRSLKGIPLLVGLTAAALLGTAVPAAATGTTVAKSTPLPFTAFQRVAVDKVHGTVFLSGEDKIVATDHDGNIRAIIKEEAGAAGMVLSPDSSVLYAALRGAQAISVIDTAKLREVGRYKLGSACPSDLAVEGGKVWFSSACPTALSGRIGSLDPATKAVTVYDMFFPAERAAPRLAMSVRDGWPDTLVVMGVGLNFGMLRSYDLSTGAPVLAAQNNTVPGVLQDIAATPDGTVVVADQDQDHKIYSLFDLSQVGTYPSGRYPTAVAIGDRGRVAAGVEDQDPSGRDQDLFVYEDGASQPTWTYDLGPRSDAAPYQKIAPAGLAWAASNDRLYVVTTLKDGSAPVLQTLVPSTWSPTSLSLEYTGAPYMGDPVGHVAEMGGSLTTATWVQPGVQTLQITRLDALGEEQLPDVVTAADGSYSFSDTIRTTGLVTYTVQFAGTDDRGASQASLAFDLASP